MATCYRHPSRETGVSCSNCGNPICPDCMTATPVGMRCPDCSRQKTPVRTMRTIAVDPIVTYALIAINVLVYVGTSSGGSALHGSGGRSFIDTYALNGPAVASGDWWLLITSGFLHFNLIHIALNMYVLWWLGRELEPSLGHVRFAVLYFASMLCGAFGALLLSADANTVGASGAIFGLFGAAFMIGRARGIDVMANGIGPLIAFNLIFTFLVGGISIGGHLGGLIGGGLAGAALEYLGRTQRSRIPGIAACVAIGAAAVAGSLAIVAGTAGV
jgi:membrane associated rhomboid family serine protease